MSELITAERAQELLDGIDALVTEIQSHPDLKGPYDKLAAARDELKQAAPDLARTVIAQAAELARLQAKVDAAEKLAEVLKTARDYVSEVAQGFAIIAKHSVIKLARGDLDRMDAALTAYKEAGK